MVAAFEGRGKLELRARKAKVWKNYWSHGAILKDNLPMGAKIKIKVLKQRVIHLPNLWSTDLVPNKNSKRTAKILP